MPDTWFVDDIRVDRFAEDAGAYNDLGQALPDLTSAQLEAALAWSSGAVDVESGRLVLSFHGWVVRTPSRCIVIDTCLGDRKDLAFRPSWHRKDQNLLAARFAAIGVDVAEVDVVVNTHLHLDHVGWNTTLTADGWRPTFPNARYVVVAGEYRDARHRAAHAGEPNAVLHRTSLAESVEPLLDHGVVDFVVADHVFDEEVRLVPAPGHTADHVAVAVGRGDDALLFTGDLVHSPLQMAYPDSRWAGDEDPRTAAATRRALLERYVDTPTLVCTMHFPEPSAGRLTRRGSGYRFAPFPAGQLVDGSVP